MTWSITDHYCFQLNTLRCAHILPRKWSLAVRLALLLFAECVYFWEDVFSSPAGWWLGFRYWLPLNHLPCPLGNLLFYRHPEDSKPSTVITCLVYLAWRNMRLNKYSSRRFNFLSRSISTEGSIFTNAVWLHSPLVPHIYTYAMATMNAGEMWRAQIRYYSCICLIWSSVYEFPEI
jgi:hypothetical protein